MRAGAAQAVRLALQATLHADAVRAGKLDPSYRIPDQHTHNLPAAYPHRWRSCANKGLFPRYLFGTELTAEGATVGRRTVSLRTRA